MNVYFQDALPLSNPLHSLIGVMGDEDKAVQTKYYKRIFPIDGDAMPAQPDDLDIVMDDSVPPVAVIENGVSLTKRVQRYEVWIDDMVLMTTALAKAKRDNAALFQRKPAPPTMVEIQNLLACNLADMGNSIAKAIAGLLVFDDYCFGLIN